MLVTGTGPLAALLGGVVPFVIPDVLKAIGAVVMAPMVRKASGL
jgi:biotin transporter BioY